VVCWDALLLSNLGRFACGHPALGTSLNHVGQASCVYPYAPHQTSPFPSASKPTAAVIFCHSFAQLNLWQAGSVLDYAQLGVNVYRLIAWYASTDDCLAVLGASSMHGVTAYMFSN
jgi:hypothetical protein